MWVATYCEELFLRCPAHMIAWVWRRQTEPYAIALQQASSFI